MASVIRRSASLTIDDSFHLEREQRRWSYRTKESDGGDDIGSRRKSLHSSSTQISSTRSTRSRNLVRSKSIAGGEGCRAGAPPASSSSPSKGKQMLRSVVGFLSRAKSAKPRKPRSFTMTVPASPASSLSRTSSESSASAHEGCQDDDSSSSARGSAHGHAAAASRPRVSFVTDVTTVFIEQMKEEEVRNTFYCRTEYAAFKEAYRMHRDSSTDWCRGNDVLPCNCDACRDDLVEGGPHIYSAAVSSAVGGASSPQADAHIGKEDSPDDHAPPPPRNPYAQDDGSGGDGSEQPECHHEPPSPVGAVFQDSPEEEEEDGSSSGGGGFEYAAETGPTQRPCPTPEGRNRRLPSHTRSRTWGVGSIPLAVPPAARSHNRGGSLDDWGVTSSVREAVKCHGEGYAYKTLRLQGFSDLYIKTHFLPS
ncbi:unnamed protein product [Ectocarpus sp. 12 AP-2014]